MIARVRVHSVELTSHIRPVPHVVRLASARARAIASLYTVWWADMWADLASGRGVRIQSCDSIPCRTSRVVS